VFVTKKRARELNDKLRERSAAHGNPVRPDQLPLGVIAYVAETQEKAEAEFVDHMRFFVEDGLRTAPQYLAPPGYLSVEQLKARAAVGDKLHGSFNFKMVSDALFVAVGTADHVANLIGEWGEMMGTTHFNIQAMLGDMPHWKVMKNLQLIAEEVMPRVRGSDRGAQALAAE